MSRQTEDDRPLPRSVKRGSVAPSKSHKAKTHRERCPACKSEVGPQHTPSACARVLAAQANDAAGMGRVTPETLPPAPTGRYLDRAAIEAEERQEAEDDAKLAALIGVGVRAVEEPEAPKDVSPEPAAGTVRIVWANFRDRLETETNDQLVASMGVTKSAVECARARLGIPGPSGVREPPVLCTRCGNRIGGFRTLAREEWGGACKTCVGNARARALKRMKRAGQEWSPAKEREETWGELARPVGVQPVGVAVVVPAAPVPPAAQVEAVEAPPVAAVVEATEARPIPIKQNWCYPANFLPWAPVDRSAVSNGPGGEQPMAEGRVGVVDLTPAEKEESAPPSAPLEAEIRARCAELADFLVAKNTAYGNAAADPVRVFSSASPLEGLRLRMDDKLSRIARGKGIERTDETVDDTKRDLAGYLVLEAVIGKSPPWSR